jgi:hypothetical protein
MLDPFSRGAIVALLALCAAGAFVLAPVRVRSSIETAQQRALASVVTATPSGTDTIVAIQRDPFAEPVTGQMTAVLARAPGMPHGPIGALPSNLSSDTIPSMPGGEPIPAFEAPRITAIVTGAHPYVMLDTGGVHEIKGIGDRVHGIAIVSIDIDGIRLQSGERLTVAGAGRP